MIWLFVAASCITISIFVWILTEDFTMLLVTIAACFMSWIVFADHDTRSQAKPVFKEQKAAVSQIQSKFQ